MNKPTEQMGSQRNEQIAEQEKEAAELEKLYPEGSAERRILDYSRASHTEGTVPPLLMGAFKVLMGISIVMAISGLIGFFFQSFLFQ